MNSRAETFIMFMKIVFVYLYAFFESDQYQWFLIVILLAMSFVAFANY